VNREPARESDQRLVRKLESEAGAREDEIRALGEREREHEQLVSRLRFEADAREEDLVQLRARVGAAEHELEDLRAIRDALTPPELPRRPGLDLAAAFVPAAAQRVSGDFYLVADGPQDSTVLVVGDAIGHGVRAAWRATFVRTAFIATAPFSDDPARLLSWVNTALVERAGTGGEFVTAACVTYLPAEQRLRWAYAGHPPALWLDDGRELTAPKQGLALGIEADPDCVEGCRVTEPGEGVLLYTDGLTEARHGGRLLGVEAVTDALGGLDDPSAGEAIAELRNRVAEFAYGALTDDLCLLAARIG
jgi:sigma-B regulation protein RsbU (phosphoserine phosphatase)